MVGWHPRLDGCEFEQAPGVGDRQGSLVCCSEDPAEPKGKINKLKSYKKKKKKKSLLQHHSSKASFLQCSAFFMVQPSHPYMTTGKTIALTRQTFVGKVMSAF